MKPFLSWVGISAFGGLMGYVCTMVVTVPASISWGLQGEAGYEPPMWHVMAVLGLALAFWLAVFALCQALFLDLRAALVSIKRWVLGTLLGGGGGPGGSAGAQKRPGGSGGRGGAGRAG